MEGFNWDGVLNTFGTLSKTYIDTRMQSKQMNNDLELARMQIQSQNQFNVPYLEGMPSGGGQVGGIPTSWLLIAGVVVLVFALKD